VPGGLKRVRLKKLTIENFQSHAHTEIDLCKGLNVIVGESDRGKSSVIRALRWLFYNEPRGTDFIRVGETECRVTGVLEDGTILTRERTPSKNRYVLELPGRKALVFEGFGSEVPEEVFSSHGAIKVQLDDDLGVSLNLAGQLEAPFLLSSPGSLKAKAIGRIHNVHIIDAAVRDTGHDIWALQKEDKSLEKNIKELDTRLKEFNDLPELSERLEKGKLIMERLEYREERREHLIRLQQQLNNIRREMSLQKEKLRRTKHVDVMEQNLGLLEGIEFRLQKIDRLYKAYTENVNNRKRVVKVLESSQKVKDGEKMLAGVEKKFYMLYNLKTIFNRIKQNTRERQRYEEIFKLTGALPHVEQGMLELGDAMERLKVLRELFRRLIKMNRDKEQNVSILQKTEYLKKAMENVGQCDKYNERKRLLIDFSARLTDTKRRIVYGQKYLKERQKEQEEGLNRYEKLLRELGRCPVCFGKVDSETIDRIIRNLGGD